MVLLPELGQRDELPERKPKASCTLRLKLTDRLVG
jgi:hypothetical protein